MESLTRVTRNLLFFLMAGTLVARAQTPGSTGSEAAANPVAQVRQARSWEYGPFVNWGTGVANRSGYKFFWAGFQVGKPLTPVLHAGIIAGQFELGGNIMPLWQAYTPPPHEQIFTYRGQSFVAPVGGGTFRGVALTPVILRWNFLTHSHRVQPWFQGAGGLIYTTHKFPPDQLVPHGTPGATSVFNFAPQGGIGFHFFLQPKRSVDVQVSGVHISSASLGDRNPGVNASVQIQVGYTFWK
ncbi:MAG: acyloxyacyl hydrolase [Acidobacteriota bacterium]|nr:acyloxyacyl hydrolase [Acidobacteriota bacterium]